MNVNSYNALHAFQNYIYYVYKAISVCFFILFQMYCPQEVHFVPTMYCRKIRTHTCKHACTQGYCTLMIKGSGFLAQRIVS